MLIFHVFVQTSKYGDIDLHYSGTEENKARNAYEILKMIGKKPCFQTFGEEKEMYIYRLNEAKQALSSWNKKSEFLQKLNREKILLLKAKINAYELLLAGKNDE